MDLNQALFTIAQNHTGDSETVEAVETILATFKTLAREAERVTVEHEALKRVAYLLVENVADERLRDEMHATYTKMAAGLTEPGE